MPFDQDRYRSLISSSTVRWELFRGTINELNKGYQCTVAGSGVRSWTMFGSFPSISVPAGNPVRTSLNIPRIIDVTQPFTFELLQERRGSAPAFGALSQRPPTGGGCSSYSVGGNFYIVTYNAAAAPAAYGMSAIPSTPMLHIIMMLNIPAASCATWINGIPVAAAFVAGASVNGADYFVDAIPGGLPRGILARAYPFALTNEDAACLYGAAHAMFPEV